MIKIGNLFIERQTFSRVFVQVLILKTEDPLRKLRRNIYECANTETWCDKKNL
jgi:hypothetical protein